MSEIQEGAQSDSIKDYKLPVCDVDTEKRNYEGYEKKVYYSLQDLRLGDWAGSTDTDSETDDRVDLPQLGKGYSKMQGKRAKMRSFKSSSPRNKDNG